MQITDEMVQRAMDAYDASPRGWYPGIKTTPLESRMNAIRAALSAALAEPAKTEGCRWCGAVEQFPPANSFALAEPASIGEVTRNGVYAASRASLPERGAMWRRLRSAGYPIISTWIDEDGPGETADFSELWPRIVREVHSAVGLVLYVEPLDFPIKGALTEVGIALGAGIPVALVRPGVVLEGVASRPLGSWVSHPLVSEYPTVELAIHGLLPHWRPLPAPPREPT